MLSSVLSIDIFLPQRVVWAVVYRWGCSPSGDGDVIYNGYQWIACTTYCGRQWLSIDTAHYTLLWLAMVIDGHSSSAHLL